VLDKEGNPRRAKPGDDPYRTGLALEWVYGTIVSTAEKARDSAKRPLGSSAPGPEAALAYLSRALEEQERLEKGVAACKALAAEMLAGRRAAAALGLSAAAAAAAAAAAPAEGEAAAAQAAAAAAAAAGEEGGEAAAAAAAATAAAAAAASAAADAAAASPAGCSDAQVVGLLRREALLTRVKVHALLGELAALERSHRQVRCQIRQARGPPASSRPARSLAVGAAPLSFSSVRALLPPLPAPPPLLPNSPL